MTLKPNTELQSGKYRIINVLGQGGFGITYLAEQVALGRNVCIKEFFLKEYCAREESTTIVSNGTTGVAPIVSKYLAKFEKEAKMIARLEHPNVVKILDIFSENGTAYYVMEYIDGASLNEIVSAEGALPESRAVAYIRKVGDGLSYVHSQKIMHLDVKPGNIMVRRDDDRPILIDFGMSKQYDEVGNQTSSTPIGVSTGYAPLELYNVGAAKDFTPQTDVYSLAATMYRMVTGQVPPSASDVMNEGLPDLPVGLSVQVKSAIEKGMQPRTKDRPASVSEFMSMLETQHVLKQEMKIETVKSSVPSPDDKTMLFDDKPTEIVASAKTEEAQPPKSASPEKPVPKPEPQRLTEAQKYEQWKEHQTKKTLTKSRNKIVFGVCAGFAEYLNCAPFTIRLITVLLQFLGIGFICYLLGAVFMPSNPKQ